MAEHMSCREVVELVSDYLDGVLDPEEASRFEQHIDLCEGCESFLDQMRATLTTVGHLTERDVPPETRDRLLTAFRDWRRSEADRAQRARQGDRPAQRLGL